MTVAFEAAKQVAGAETHVMYDIKVAVRPTDGKAFVIGTTTDKVWFGRLGGAPVRDIHGASGENATQWPTLTFGNDGTGYAAWRSANGWRGWLQQIPPGWDGEALPPGRDIAGAMSAAAPGATNVSQLDFAFSRKSNKLYAAAYFEFGTYAATGFAESSDGGNTWGGYRELARDMSRSNQAPKIAVTRSNDNVHVIARNDNDLITISRIGGLWDQAPTRLAGSNIAGWDVRSIDGKVSKGVVEAPNGTLVAVWKNRGTNSFGVSLKKPGEAWKTITTAGLPGAYIQTVAIDTSPDGRVYLFVQGDNAPNSGAYLLVLDPQQETFTGPTVIPIKPEPVYGSNGCSLDFAAYGGRLWLAWTTKGGGPETTYYTSSVYDGTVPDPPPIIPHLPPPPPPPPVQDEFLPPSSVSVEPTSFNQVTINWKDKTSDEVEFSVERKEDGTEYRIVGSAPANATRWLDVIDIKPGTRYTYRVRAHKTGRYSNYSMEVSTVTPAKPEEPPVPKPIPADPSIEVLNGFKLGHGMLDYWKKCVIIGVPHPLGLPLSDETDWTSPSGKKYVIQVFERGVLGYDGNEPNIRYRVQPLLIGEEWLRKHRK